MFLCIEILGESAFHKFLIQSGWSGKDYVFHYNRHTNSHMRAYRTVEEYYAERVDMHKSINVWPLLGNMLPADRIESQVFTDARGRSTGTTQASEPARNRERSRNPRATERVQPVESVCH